MRVQRIADAGGRGRRNGERGIRRVLVGRGILAVAEVPWVVVVQQVVVARLAARVDGARQRREIIENGPNSGRTGIEAIAVGAAARNRRRGIGRRIARIVAVAVAVLRIPVVGARGGVRILDLAHRTRVGVRAALVGRGEHFDVLRRRRRFAGRIAVPDHVGMAEHDVIRAGAAVHGLVKVVAHRVIVRKALQVRDVALLHVVEPERARALSGRRGVRRILGAEVLGLRGAVGAGADRHLHPGEQLPGAAGRILARRSGDVAIDLLPHLIEAMHRDSPNRRCRGTCVPLVSWKGPAGRLFTSVMRSSGVALV